MKPTLLGPPPQIKILKRPQHNGSRGNHGNSNENGQAKPRYQVKTLQQVMTGFSLAVSLILEAEILLLIFISFFFHRKRQNMLKLGYASWEKLHQQLHLHQTQGFLLNALNLWHFANQ